MNENKEAANNPDLAETIADTEIPSTSEAEPKEASRPGKVSIKLPIFLLFIVLLTAGFILAPQQLKNDLIDTIKTLLEPEEVAPPKAPEAAMLAVTAEDDQAPEPEVVADITPPAPEAVAASSDEVNRMLAAMDDLQNELKSLRQEQQTIQETQLSLQKMQLRTRLRWITNRANHLPQLQLAWEEIALMPSASSDKHATAQKMLALAQQRLQDLRNWQQSLQSHADSLATPEHANIIPAYETPWLSWIRNYFSIRTASTAEQRQDEQLRQQLLNTSRNIELEQWPDGKSWQQLRATLQLRLVKAAKDSPEAVELALPESFDPLKSDIEQLRQAASMWLEELS